MRRFVLTSSIVLACGIVVGAAFGGSAAAPVYTNPDAVVTSISCPAPGDCVAGGYYATNGSYSDDEGGSAEAFVVSETNGSWGNPIDVPGMTTLNARGLASVDVISCAEAGECVAGGHYTSDISDPQNQRAFVVSQRNGSWGNAIEVPGMATLSTGDARLDSLSCGAAGDCAASGGYSDRHGNGQAFVVSEANGAWGTAIKVPGTASLNLGHDAEALAVSCAAAGECAAGGTYTGGGPNYHSQAFVVSETNGSWGTAVDVPGTSALNSGGIASVKSISCAGAGECVAGGFYTDGSGNPQAFLAGETNGSWGDAIEVPERRRLNAGGIAYVSSISCVAPGECAAGGTYTDGSGNEPAFLVSETNGSWGDAVEMPGMATIVPGDGGVQVDSISCGAPGDCAAGGQTVSCCDFEPFVVGETNGSWSDATLVPGTSSVYGYGGVNSVSCAPAGECTAGGFYVGGDALGYHTQAFAAGEMNGSWGSASRVRNFPALCVVPHVVGKALLAAKERLRHVHCGPGKITYAYSNVRKGRVAAQHPTPGKILNVGARVALTVSKGAKR